MQPKMLVRTWSVRLAMVLLLAPLLVARLSGTALAAAPNNDMFTGATEVSLGFSEVIDTTEATTDADDAQANATCGAPATAASVWYKFTPATDTVVVVDVSQSDYVAGLLVGVGSQGSLVTVRCGAGSVSFPATAGTTYYVMIFDFDGVGNGGLVNISFRELPPPPPPPTVDITVDPVGRVDPSSGIATFSGTYTCTNSDHIVINGSVRQNVGRLFTIQGYFNFYDFRDANDADPCDGTPHPWTANATPESGKFGGGRATVDVAPYTCTPGGCDGESLTLTVPLRGGAKTASASLNTLFLPAIPNRR